MIYMPALMDALGAAEIDGVLLEGGGTLNWAMLEAGLVQRVCGFLRDPDGCILCGVWKVYENVDEAARTFERFRRCSACICRHMDNGRSLTQIFNAG